MAAERIFVTGIGIISPTGKNLGENLVSLRNSRSGIKKAVHLHSRYTQNLLFGEVDISNENLFRELEIQDEGVTRTSLLSLHAFIEAVNDAGLDKESIASTETCFISADTVGGMCLTEQMFEDANNKSEGSRYLGAYDFAASTLFVEQLFNMQGITNTINTACSSSANAIIMAARMLRHGRAKRAIAGGCDSLSKFTVNGFSSLGILDPGHCRPFSANRQGLNLGEGAAYLVLEKESDCRDKKRYAELRGFANANDAYHPSSLSPEGVGPYLAMQGALDAANIGPSAVSYVNAHGTGTENNDLVEGVAMKRVFGNVPGFSSTKSFTGHTLGAAGAIEAVFSICSIVFQELYPNLRFSEPVQETGLKPVTAFQKGAVEHVLSNSFGFGGNCSSLLFSKTG